MIVLARCDDRLIHGQCMTVIVQEYDIRSIIIVDNETAENPILRVVFETAGTNSAPVAVCTAFEALSRISEAMISPVNVLLLMKSPETYLRLLGRPARAAQRAEYRPYEQTTRNDFRYTGDPPAA